VFLSKKGQKGSKRAKKGSKKASGDPQKGGSWCPLGSDFSGLTHFHKKNLKKTEKNRFENHDFRFFSSKNIFGANFFVFGHKKFFYDSKSSVMFQYGAIKSACDEKVEAMRDAEEDAGG